MALLWIDGFDTYNTGANLTSNGYIGTNIGNFSFTSSTRFGVGQAATSSYGGFLTYNFPSSIGSVVVGSALNLNSSGPNGVAWYLNDGATTQISLQANFTYNRLDIFSGNGTTLLGSTPTNSFLPNAWAYVEVKATIGTSGSVAVQINGTLVLTLTSVNTQVSANSTVNSFSLGASYVPSMLCDDLYICDTTGSAPTNTFLGDVRVNTIFPSGAGSSTQFNTTGSSNWATVATANPNSTSVYNYQTTVGNSDLFAIPSTSVAVASTVYGAALMTYAYKDNTGVKQIANKVYSGGSSSTLSTFTLGSSGLYDYSLMKVNPITSSAWTPTAINALQIGYTIIT